MWGATFCEHSDLSGRLKIEKIARGLKRREGEIRNFRFILIARSFSYFSEGRFHFSRIHALAATTGGRGRETKKKKKLTLRARWNSSRILCISLRLNAGFSWFLSLFFVFCFTRNNNLPTRESRITSRILASRFSTTECFFDILKRLEFVEIDVAVSLTIEFAKCRAIQCEFGSARFNRNMRHPHNI